MSNLAEKIKKEQEKSKREHLELAFKLQLKAVGLANGWQCEYQFDKARKWRFDFALVENKLAIEVEGGTHSNGRHVRGATYSKDCEKYNTASAQGWTLFRFTSDMIKSGKAILFVQDYFKGL